MPTALYLYNSRDFAAIDFYQSLKKAFDQADWRLLSDFNEGLEGTGGNSFDRLSSLIRDVDAIVYAIGPLGPGTVQGNFEAGQVIQAQQDAARNQRQLKVVPVLVGSADASLIPDSMRYMTAQMDNYQRDGMTALQATFRYVVDKDLPTLDEAEHQPLLSKEDELSKFCKQVAYRAQKRGLTLFIGPYAAADVHGTAGPGELGRALLERARSKAQMPIAPSHPTSGRNAPDYPGELLTHPWIAASAIRLLQEDYDEVWDTLCEVVEKQPLGKAPLPFERTVAVLARAWMKLGGGPPGGSEASWKGLLLVTTAQDIRLEQALWKDNIPFTRLRCLGAGRLSHEEPRAGGANPDFVEVGSFNGWPSARGTAVERPKLDLKPVLLLKLMDCCLSKTTHAPPLATGQHLKAMWKRLTLPDPLPRHLKKAPFVMLGGGLLNPLVSLAFSMHFLPYFEGWDTEINETDRYEDDEKVPRHIVLHPWPGQADAIRRFEREVDRKLPSWPEDVFNLKRVDWPLLELVSRLAYHIVEERGR